jgi:hypothetical protein
MDSHFEALGIDDVLVVDRLVGVARAHELQRRTQHTEHRSTAPSRQEGTQQAK